MARKKPKIDNPDWVTTTQLAKTLGCSTRHVYRLIDKLPMKKGQHYIRLDPNALRPTYRFNMVQIKKLLEE